MRKMSACVMGSVIWFASVCATAQEPVFTSSEYQCKIFSRYLKNSGIINLKKGDKTLISRNRVSAGLKDPGGKNVGIWEKANPEYIWKNNVLTSRKTVVSRDAMAEPYAETSREIQFSDNKISSEIVIKNLRDMTFAQTWTVYQENVFFITEPLIGMRLDGVKMDSQPLSTVIPRKFDKKKWGFKDFVKKLTLTGQDQTTIRVTAAPNCKLRFIHYGGKEIELYVQPIIKPQDLRQKAGQEMKIGYSIEFGKGE